MECAEKSVVLGDSRWDKRSLRFFTLTWMGHKGLGVITLESNLKVVVASTKKMSTQRVAAARRERSMLWIIRKETENKPANLVRAL